MHKFLMYIADSLETEKLIFGRETSDFFPFYGKFQKWQRANKK